MSKPDKLLAIVRARTAWGAGIPDWVVALATECDRTSQAATAKRLGKSGALVSQVLANIYPADLSTIEQIIRGVLMAETLTCPVVGDLASDSCLTHQRAPWAPHNPQRIVFFIAGQNCPNSRNGGSHG